MKDSERISNLEEMLAEILIRLDSVDNELVQLRKGQSQTIGRMDSLEENMRDLAKHMFLLNDRQTLIEDTMRDHFSDKQNYPRNNGHEGGLEVNGY
jgi:uncharacterized coiled-coil protein SlyX